MCKKCNFDTQNFKNLSTVHTLSLLGLFAPSLWPPLKNPGYTTVISVAKEGTRGHPPPPPR